MAREAAQEAVRAHELSRRILTQRFGREVLPLFASGTVHPVVDSRYPMERIADAHRHMESNANIGKILIDVGV